MRKVLPLSFLPSFFLSFILAWSVCGTMTHSVADPGDESVKPQSKSAALKPPPTLSEIEQWIVDLNAPEFTKREEATRQLVEAGAVAVEPLKKAAAEAKLETSVRITAILRAWFGAKQDELVELTESALEELSTSKNRNIAGRATTILQQHDDIREERAIVQIKRLGGIIKQQTEGLSRRFGNEERPDFWVILGREWKGGDLGLRYVRRLSPDMTMYLLRDRKTGAITTPGVTKEALEELQRGMPQLKIQYRGPAVLGIHPLDLRIAGCVVRVVAPNSPAEIAKIKAGDVISKFEENPVDGFEGLVDLIAQKQPGDTVKLEILRGDDAELTAYFRLKSSKDPLSEDENKLLDELRKRLSRDIEVKLGEWSGN